MRVGMALAISLLCFLAAGVDPVAIVVIAVASTVLVAVVMWKMRR
jgi:hypothetical protein